jgi:hypothetical protein
MQFSRPYESWLLCRYIQGVRWLQRASSQGQVMTGSMGSSRRNHHQSDVRSRATLKRRLIRLLLAALILLPACGGSSSDLTPKLVGKRLDIAKSDLKGAGVDEEKIQVVGGGAFGALDESNWTVCDQEPDAGVELSDAPRLLIDRTCGAEDTFEAAAGTPAPTSEAPRAESPAATAPTVSASPAGPPPEVKVDKCVKEGIEVIASGTVRNVDTVSRSFAITIEFYDKGGAKIEQGTDFVSVGAGQTVRWQQDNFTEESYTLGDCKIASVS